MATSNRKNKKKQRQKDNTRIKNFKRGSKTKKTERTKLSPNAKMIKDFMVSQKVKGDFRDYVVITGSRMIDHEGSYDLVFKNPKGLEGIVLYHKKDLHKIISEENSSRFWHPSLGRKGAKK